MQMSCQRKRSAWIKSAGKDTIALLFHQSLTLEGVTASVLVKKKATASSNVH